MITITIQAPKALLLVLASFAKAQWLQWLGKAVIASIADRSCTITADQWKLVYDDITRQIKEAK